MTQTGYSLAAASSWRAHGWPRLLPVNVTISTNFRCNFRCQTCNVYDRKVKELEADEWAQVFRSLGRSPVWMTFSGGEPFLRGDLPDIILSAIETCQPAIVNIPTNGWFTKRVVAGVKRICEEAPGTQLVINLSIDHHVPERHDTIRGAPGSWPRMMRTLAGLRALDLPNLTVGVHTVVSSENEDDFPAIAQNLTKLGADSYIAEPAEERVELQTIDTGISPKARQFRVAAAAVLDAEDAANGMVARAARSVRNEYYGRVTRFLEGETEAMPVCHAGFLSVHVGAEGDVWSCCVLARSFGNLRDADFDFPTVWFSPEAEEFRTWMRERHCACPLANAAYTNLLVDPGAATRIAAGMVRKPKPLAAQSAHAITHNQVATAVNARS
ncbi:MAG TPA: radical SAM protein [Acidimicrobiales bacterium]|nr:radical SAM protein [Acidimicrobiales bacterium]